MEPEKEFRPRKNREALVSRVIEDGRDDVKLFNSICRVCRALRTPSEVGIEEDNLLPGRLNIRREERNPIEEGMDPVREL